MRWAGAFAFGVHMEAVVTNTGSADLSVEYWAAMDTPGTERAEPDGARIAAELMRKAENYYNFYGSTGLFERDRRSYMSRYGISPDGENVSYRVVRTGDNGQIAAFTPNHYANILTHMSTLVAAKKPGLQGRAENGDADSIQQAKLADAVIDHFTRELDIEGVSRDSLSMALIMRECWMWVRWDHNAGDPYVAGRDPLTGTPIAEKTGGFQISTHQPGDVIRDVTALDIRDPRWVMIRDFANKWDLVARFPEHKDEILGIARNQSDPYRVEFQTTVIESDLIPIYQFYHQPTEALPQGRQCTLVSARGLLLDGPLGYGGQIPVIPLMPERLHGTPFGYTPMFELLALQQILNALYSGMVTDEVAFAVRRILVPRGQPLTATMLQSNLGVLYYDAALPKPEIMQTPLNTEERLAGIQAIERLFGTLSGINDVIRGNAESSGVKAASGLALLQAQALQFLSYLEFEYGRFWQRWGNLCLSILRARATAPQMISVAGKNKASTLRSFKGDQLPNNYRVTVDLGNPVLKTAAGRQTIADNMLQTGAFGQGQDAGQKYMEFINTGTLEPQMNADTAEQDLILAENEMMMRGEVPNVSIVDSHDEHDHDHAIVAYSREARQGPMGPTGMPMNPITQALMQHMQMHAQAKAKLAQFAAQQNAMAATASQAGAASMTPPPAPGPAGGTPPPAQGPTPHRSTPGAPMTTNMPTEPVQGVRMAQPARPPPGASPVDAAP